MILLNGKQVAEIIGIKIKHQIESLDFIPVFSIIQVGNNLSSNKYIRNKLSKAQELGIIARHIKIPEKINQQDLLHIIKKESKICHGLIVQLPLPNHLNKETILNSIPIKKDIDGLSNLNSESFYGNGKNYIIPATARGIMDLIKEYKIEVKNKKVAIIGESLLVGKPTKELFIKAGANVQSYNIDTGISGTEYADIIVVAAGSPYLVKRNNIKENAIIVDVGINVIDIYSENIITGDVDFEDVKDKVYAISPVPGGVGPMTVISLFSNLIDTIKTNNLKGIE